ncbi:hypothetical protein Rsub_10312 [Raphidocelis subcapitata]|uniref:Uncharacterized protein n=1 Tax=Raphidocelis subcapitata TaxID=307507 RepID=A0A2V0PJC0_9CHLO|nr:hypothetical protein Rsub_10312 [Raphidocelis subcapitata]|eukprot:GBF98083.1 hypothetical protein Rsub_10312 [Raphidocelis subcapitata]
MDTSPYERSRPAPAGGGGSGGAGERGSGAAAEPLQEPQLLSQRAQQALSDHLASVYLAVLAFVRALRSPAVWAGVKRAAKPIVIAAVAQYLVLRALLLPVSLVLRLVGLLKQPTPTFSSHDFVAKSLSIYPLVCIVLTNYVYRSSLADCFFAALKELDPQHAARLASREPLQRRRGLREKVAGFLSDDADDPWQLLIFTLLVSTLRSWRWVQLGPLGYAVIPLAQFLSFRYMVGRPRVAAALTLACCVHRPVEPLVMDAVEAWTSSRALGRSSMRHYLARAVPSGRHAAFMRAFEASVVTYFMLPTLAMRMPAGALGPFLGPLMMFPAAAVAAQCVRDITTRTGSERALDKLLLQQR